MHEEEHALLEHLKQAIFEHPPDSPDLAPSDYNLFLYLKKLFSDQSLRSDQETKDSERDLFRLRHTKQVPP